MRELRRHDAGVRRQLRRVVCQLLERENLLRERAVIDVGDEVGHDGPRVQCVQPGCECVASPPVRHEERGRGARRQQSRVTLHNAGLYLSAAFTQTSWLHRRRVRRGQRNRCLGATTRRSPPRSPTPASFRPARPSDDAACKALEVSASQFQDRLTDGRLIKFALHHYGRFDAKCAQFADWVVLVCEDTTRGGAVVGVIEVVLAEMHVHGARHWRGGFLFDLRVDGGYQRRGIGRALSHAAEAAGAARGAAYLYLSVNGTNQKSRSLFNSMGWRPASRRCLVFRPLLLPQKVAAAAASLPPPAAWPAPLEREAAERMAATHYARRDLGLDRTGFGSLFSSELYLGTWHAKDGAGSEAALSLWAGSAFVGFLRPPPLPPRARVELRHPTRPRRRRRPRPRRRQRAALGMPPPSPAPPPRPSCAPASSPPPPPLATAAWRVIGFVIRGRTAVRARAINVAPVYSRSQLGAADARRPRRGGEGGARPRVRLSS